MERFELAQDEMAGRWEEGAWLTHQGGGIGTSDQSSSIDDDFNDIKTILVGQLT